MASTDVIGLNASMWASSRGNSDSTSRREWSRGQQRSDSMRDFPKPRGQGRGRGRGSRGLTRGFGPASARSTRGDSPSAVISGDYSKESEPRDEINGLEDHEVKKDASKPDKSAAKFSAAEGKDNSAKTPVIKVVDEEVVSPEVLKASNDTRPSRNRQKRRLSIRESSDIAPEVHDSRQPEIIVEAADECEVHIKEPGSAGETRAIDGIAENVQMLSIDSNRPLTPSAKFDWSLEEDDSLPSLDDWNVGATSKMSGEENVRMDVMSSQDTSLEVHDKVMPQSLKDDHLHEQRPEKPKGRGDRKRGKGRERIKVAERTKQANAPESRFDPKRHRLAKGNQAGAMACPQAASPLSCKKEELSQDFSLATNTKGQNHSVAILLPSFNIPNSSVEPIASKSHPVQSQSKLAPIRRAKMKLPSEDVDRNESMQSHTSSDSTSSQISSPSRKLTESMHQRAESLNPGISNDRSPKKGSPHTRTQSMPFTGSPNAQSMRTRTPQTKRPIIAASAFQMISKSLRPEVPASD